MKCIAIDDEPIALAIISSYCKAYPEISLTTYTDPVQGINAVKEQNPDLLFLDIEMNEYSGIELARQVPHNTLLVFTTAHVNYALKGYEVKAIDFLPKPFSPQRFDASIQRVKELLKEKTPSITESITIKVEYQNVSIALSDISYIEAQDNYIQIMLTNGKSHSTKMSIKTIAELLPTKEFIRVHRSYIIARSKIQSYTKKQISLANHKIVPIGRNYAEAFLISIQ